MKQSKHFHKITEERLEQAWRKLQYIYRWNPILDRLECFNNIQSFWSVSWWNTITEARRAGAYFASISFRDTEFEPTSKDMSQNENL